MNRFASIWVSGAVERLLKLWQTEGGAEIAEFAVSIPLLAVFVVGIFDFGSAFTVKQKISNVALQGARVAANQPSNDLSATGTCGAPPPSVCAVRDVVASTLAASKLNDCGLAGATGAVTGTALAWTFTPNTGCSGTLTLTIERGYHYNANLPSPPFQTAVYTVEASRVTVQYPYRWQFSRVIPVLVRGAQYPSTSAITSVAVMQNLN
jgi:hypothetical protein